jgi:MFS family permease
MAANHNPGLDEKMPETLQSIAPETGNQSSVVDLEKIAAAQEPVRNVHGFKVDHTPGSSY